MGADVARILDEHFADPNASPKLLADRFQGLYIPIHHNDNIAAAARRAGEIRGREAGRWLVRHGTDTDPVTIGLALLAEVGTADDIPLIQTIGLLSLTFGPLAAHALERLPDGATALIWLAERVTGWGRVYVVESLCRLTDEHPAVRPWLLRRAADGDFLNAYFAGRVAHIARLHEAVADFGNDAELFDQATLILHTMTYSEGMGETLRHYPHSAPVLEAYVRHLERVEPAARHYFLAATIAHYLTKEKPERPEFEARWQQIRASCLALLDRHDWCDTARHGLAAEDARLTWLADSVAAELELRAFLDDRPEPEA
ncbi:hypothetical protein [Embleya sp. NPDC059259]|uniref:hypothetical protein n=1 Tax=unclassified Embleya TaxID=2699296 RepID=UPI0036C14FB6